MRISRIDEPELEFGRDRHVCPRAGIEAYDVYDARLAARRDRILVGAVGNSAALTSLAAWLEQCRRPIPGKPDASQPHLFPGFCGFNRDIGFRADLVFGDELTRPINNSEIRRIKKIPKWNERIQAAVDVYFDHVRFLAQNRAVDVIVCVIPSELYKLMSSENYIQVEEKVESDDQDDIVEMNFRRALKARALKLGKPLQLIIEDSLESNKHGRQDDATKAWNFCTALYYKASPTVPWRLPASKNRPPVCFVGIGFYRSRDRKILNTSLAQVFDELGNGVILRGTPVDIDKDDRHPYLTDQQAFDLLSRALDEYRAAMGNFPGRLVLHKTSMYSELEQDGFRQAASAVHVGATDFVTILDTDYRLLRRGIYPPFRGTHIEIDDASHLLYSRGSVEYYETYPGKYIPEPIELRIVESDESPRQIVSETLALTKMNWNNTQFDGKYPITIVCARKVGQILKYLEPNEQPQTRYGFYM